MEIVGHTERLTYEWKINLHREVSKKKTNSHDEEQRTEQKIVAWKLQERTAKVQSRNIEMK